MYVTFRIRMGTAPLLLDFLREVGWGEWLGCWCWGLCSWDCKYQVYGLDFYPDFDKQSKRGGGGAGLLYCTGILTISAIGTR